MLQNSKDRLQIRNQRVLIRLGTKFHAKRISGLGFIRKARMHVILQRHVGT